MRSLMFALVLLLCSTRLLANEGMWLPQLLGALNEKEMKAMGMKITAKDIYDINNGSLKDAICQFGGGCTGEIISGEGLLLTNHHCGFDMIQKHTTLDRNYIRNGFWAMNRAEEKPNPGLTATFIVRIDDVTADVLLGVTAQMSERDRQSAIDKNINALRANVKKEADEGVIIRPFFNGNKYFMFITLVFRDIRLVGAPPQSIGAFGADTDNWVWPRHGGDFSVFRVYANAQNRPADYSAENVPMKPRHFLPISLDGVAEGDFTMVFGFPGRTTSYLPSVAVQQIMEVSDPAKIEIRDRALRIMNGYMRADEKIKIQYSAIYAGIANSWKKWIGEVKGLKSSKAVEKKLAYEAEFMKRIKASPLLIEKYGTVLDELYAQYKGLEKYALARDYYNEVTGNCQMLGQANRLLSLVRVFESNGAEAFEKEKNNLLKQLPAYYKDYQEKVDKSVFTALYELYMKNVPPEFIDPTLVFIYNEYKNNAASQADKIYSETALVSEEKMKALLNRPAAEAVAAIKGDYACRVAALMTGGYLATAAPKISEYQTEINRLQRIYMQAQMDAFADKRFYPDANSTMRITYGNVKPYKPRDGVKYEYYTWLDGVMEKYVPGDYEFDIPARLLELYKNKDYGQYGVNGKMPVCFIAANHTTGGNSGSPALDAYGNLVGLNFDRVWEGTMSDINYDPDICRNIMVDARYVLFIIDKLGGAGHLIKELKLVHPKKK